MCTHTSVVTVPTIPKTKRFTVVANMLGNDILCMSSIECNNSKKFNAIAKNLISVEHTLYIKVCIICCNFST